MSDQVENPMPKHIVRSREFALPTALPCLGVAAPEFEASPRTQDSPGGLSRNWLVLFSHPADFTPVCTTEFLALRPLPGLRQRKRRIAGLSIDSPTSHIAWVRNIKEKFGIDIHFHLGHSNKEVATLYGMFMPGESKTETSRPLCFRDRSRWDRRAMIITLSPPPQH